MCLNKIDLGFYAFAASVPFMLVGAIIVMTFDWMVDEVKRIGHACCEVVG